MRIVIDMQGAQTPFSRHRGVGRYTMGLVTSLLHNHRDHEIFLALNGAFQDAIGDIRDEFEGLLPQEKIRVWQQFYNCSAINHDYAPAKWAAEISREVFLNSLNPDIIFSTNLQEGLFDPAPTSVKLLSSKALFCTTLHDVIPMVYPQRYNTLPSIQKWYDEKIEGARKSDIILTVSEHSKKEIIELVGVPSDSVAVIYNAVDHLKFRQKDIHIEERRALLSRLGITKPFLLYSGGADIHKNLNRLYQAYARLPIETRNDHQLVMVGKELNSNQEMHRSILRKLGFDSGVVFTGYLNDNDLISLYNLCKLFVFPSIHEGFGLPPLEAMACGAPVIASKAASLPEVVGLGEALFDPYDEADMAQKMERALINSNFREHLKQIGIARAASFSWDTSASKLLDILESAGGTLKKNGANSSTISVADPVKTTIEEIAAGSIAAQLKSSDMMAIAVSLSETYPSKSDRPRKLFLDVSAMIQNRDHTGIQRVVRAICYELVRECQEIEAEPVYTSLDDHEFYRAGVLIDKIHGYPVATTDNARIEFYSGDILLYLDLHPGVAISHIEKTRYLRNKGVTVYHVVYDLLPARFPHFFWPELCDEFVEWLKALSHANGAICISRAVALELQQWMMANTTERKRPFRIGWFHLGSDIENSIPTCGIPPDGVDTIGKISSGTSFLVVGTIEPRKGQDQILDSFELLWSDGVNVSLVIVGKKGWGMENLANRLLSHAEYGNRLHWLDRISDEYLEKIYASCVCLIAASEGEGFGLPLIEAARHKIPVIARDIPVFREVAGEHAYYFKGSEPHVLADTIQRWIELCRQGSVPQSCGMPRLTWAQSAEQLMAAILDKPSAVSLNAIGKKRNVYK